MKKSILMVLVTMFVAVTTFAFDSTMINSFKKRDWDALKASVDSNYKLQLTQIQLRENIMYDLIIKIRAEKTIAPENIESSVDALAKEKGLTSEAEIFRIKYFVLDGWWNGVTDGYKLRNEYIKKNKELLDRIKDVPTARFFVINSYNVSGLYQEAYDLASKNEMIEAVYNAKYLGNDVLIEAASNALLKWKKITITASDVQRVTDLVLEECYESKYNEQVKEFLTNANNKYVKNITKSEDWKKAVTTIQLGLLKRQ